MLSCDECKLRFMCKVYDALYLIEDDFMAVVDFDDNAFLEMTTSILEKVTEHCKFFVED